MADYARMKPVKKNDDLGILLLAGLGGCLLVLFILVYGIVTSGWVLTILWAWFVVPAFKLPALSLPVAIGISAMIRTLTYIDTSDLQKKEKTREDQIGSIVGNLLSPWWLLALGWIVHFFV